MGSENIHEISNDEIIHALRSMKNNRVPGEEDIVIEMIKEAEEVIVPKLKVLFNISLEKEKFRKLGTMQ